MLGNITNSDQLQEDDALKTILSMTENSIKIPDGYHAYGALNTELQLAESLLTSSRLANAIRIVSFRLAININTTSHETHTKS